MAKKKEIKERRNLTETGSVEVFNRISDLIEQARKKLPLQLMKRWLFFTGILGKQSKRK